MKIYNKMLDHAKRQGIIVIENFPLKSDADAILCKNVIGLSDRLDTTIERKCILAEELAHYDYNVGNILDQSDINNSKQEYIARKRAVNELLSLGELVDAFKKGFRETHELAEELEITEKFLKEAIEILRKTYGEKKVEKEYTIYFEPYLYFRKK